MQFIIIETKVLISKELVKGQPMTEGVLRE